jgi:hypothetical protein
MENEAPEAQGAQPEEVEEVPPYDPGKGDPNLMITLERGLGRPQRPDGAKPAEIREK